MVLHHRQSVKMSQPFGVVTFMYVTVAFLAPSGQMAAVIYIPTMSNSHQARAASSAQHAQLCAAL